LTTKKSNSCYNFFKYEEKKMTDFTRQMSKQDPQPLNSEPMQEEGQQ
jgi:hypothetical protein